MRMLKDLCLHLFIQGTFTTCVLVHVLNWVLGLMQSIFMGKVYIFLLLCLCCCVFRFRKSFGQEGVLLKVTWPVMRLINQLEQKKSSSLPFSFWRS